MTQTPIKLSDTARAILELAAGRDDHLVRPPPLPAAARLQVVRSMLNNRLVEEIAAPVTDDGYAWRTGEDGVPLMLRATAAGLAAIGDAAQPDSPPTIEAYTQQVVEFLAEEGCNATILEEAEATTMVADGFAKARPAARVAGNILAWLVEIEDEAEDAADAPRTVAGTAPALPARETLRTAAQAVLDAWADETNRETDMVAALKAPMAALEMAPSSRRCWPCCAGTRARRSPRSWSDGHDGDRDRPSCCYFLAFFGVAPGLAGGSAVPTSAVDCSTELWARARSPADGAISVSLAVMGETSIYRSDNDEKLNPVRESGHHIRSSSSVRVVWAHVLA